MTGILLTQSTTFIIGPVAQVLGLLMNAIYNCLDSFLNIQNIGLSIIVFTIVIYTLMIPLTYQQQKFQKLSSVMQPEIKAIQAKYKNKKDQASQQKMMDETKLVYEKYGTKQTGGCLQLLIQMPILFGLYRVIQNMPAYVDEIKANYLPLIEEIQSTDGYVATMETIGEASPVSIDPSKYDYTEVNTLVDVLYKFQDETWVTLQEAFPSMETLINTTKDGIEHLNYFLGINIANSPMATIQDNYKTNLLIAFVALMIPVLAGLSQFISIKLISPSAGQEIDSDNPMASSMQSMNTTMPLLSVFMCFTLPAGLGIYWIASAVVRTVQQLIIKKYLSKQSLDEMIEKNREKAAKTREKKGTSANRLNELAQKNAKRVEESKSQQMSQSERDALIKKSKENAANAKSGSLASKANMVKNFNENSKK